MREQKVIKHYQKLDEKVIDRHVGFFHIRSWFVLSN
uniref:Uncharacterized protein n=1 Tax=Rhizophora mucronata TaxID=61149 RepID=A0A2P2QCD5_RHIMU